MTALRHGRLALTLQEVMTATVRLRAQRQVAADAASFREHVRHLLGIAEREALDSGYTGDDVRLALFAVVAFLDESVLNSSNPMFAEWPRRPLQDELFGGNVGGEAFFQQVRGLLVRQDSEQLADLLEVYQLCMLLGFHGRYSATESGDMQSLIAQVGSKIRRARGLVGKDGTTDLSPSWRPPKDTIPASPTDPWVRRLGIAAAIAAVVAVALFVVYVVVLKAGGIKA
jgi:type VI secretion system protein ImpK